MQRPRHLPEGIVRRQRAAAIDEVAHQFRMLAGDLVERGDDDAAIASLVGQRTARDGALVDMYQGGRALGQLGIGATLGSAGRRVRLDCGEVDGAQVEVGHEQLVGLGRQLRHQFERGQSVGSQPVGLP